MSTVVKTLFQSAIVTLLTLYASASFASDILCSTKVKTQQGNVTGKPDNDACTYQGIPYAKPPIGELRWQAPRLPENRNKSLPASAFSDTCIKGKKNVSGSEDCLYLNIWRSRKTTTSKPVMLWIHGGTNTGGSGSDGMFNGSKLAVNEDVIVITINYRLGVFGFFGHPSIEQVPGDPKTAYFNSSSVSHLHGNYGLLDQIAALKWVKKNIKSFGGNPNNITLFGESAGAWGVCNMLVSPETKGLFQRAIMESQGCAQTSTYTEAMARIKTVTKNSDCASAVNIAGCLLRMDPVKLQKRVHQGSDVVSFLSKNDLHTRPYVDGTILPQLSTNAIKNGDFHRVPVMIGTNRREDIYFLPYYWATSQFRNHQKALDKILPLLNIDYDDFKEVYDDDDYINGFDKIAAAWGDYVIECPTFRAAQRISRHQPLKTFQYYFTYDDHFMGKDVGATHGLEIGLVFDTLDVDPFSLLYNTKQRKKARPTVKKMQAYWAHFARTGQPNNILKRPVWPPRGLPFDNVLQLDDPIQWTNSRTHLELCEFLELHGAKF